MAIPGLEKNIGVLLEKSAALHGEKTAIHFDHEGLSISYTGLNATVNQPVQG